MLKRTTRQEPSLIFASVLGIGSAIITSVLICTIVAAFVVGERMEEAAMGYGAGAAILLGAMTGAMLASWKAKENRLIICLVVGAGMFLTLLCTGLLLFEGELQNIGVTALLAVGGSCGMGLLGLRRKKQTVPGKIKRKTGHFVHIA